jgi:uncharacterized protein (DUF983 family)
MYHAHPAMARHGRMELAAPFSYPYGRYVLRDELPVFFVRKAMSTLSEPLVPVLPAETGKRTWITFSRAIRRHCPYCGGGGIFSSYFTLKERCPHCHTLFAYEDGYFLGSYVINIGVTELAAVGIVIWLMIATSLSVLQLQIIGVILAVGLPIAFYPVAVCLWMVLDLVVHPPSRGSGRPRQ